MKKIGYKLIKSPQKKNKKLLKCVFEISECNGFKSLGSKVIQMLTDLTLFLIMHFNLKIIFGRCTPLLHSFVQFYLFNFSITLSNLFYVDFQQLNRRWLICLNKYDNIWKEPIESLKVLQFNFWRNTAEKLLQYVNYLARNEFRRKRWFFMKF